MRINSPGKPGLFACDHCGRPQLKGVYTGHAEFAHLCSACRDAACKPVSNPPEPPILRVDDGRVTANAYDLQQGQNVGDDGGRLNLSTF